MSRLRPPDAERIRYHCETDEKQQGNRTRWDVGWGIMGTFEGHTRWVFRIFTTSVIQSARVREPRRLHFRNDVQK